MKIKLSGLKRYQYDKYIYTFIFIFALCLRLWRLNIFPVGISYDEMEYIINAKAIWLTGSDVFGVWHPWLLNGIKASGTVLAELTALLLAPMIGPFPFNLFLAKLPFALSSSLLILATCLITKELLDRETAFIVGILMAINPWSFHFGRMATESPITLLFFFTAFLIILRTKTYRMLWSLPFLWGAFLTYHGSKAVLLPFVGVSFVSRYLIKQRKEITKPYWIILGACLVMIFFFIVSLRNQPAGSRTQELIFFDNQKASQAVNQERQTSIPSKFGYMFSNKATYILKTMVNNYMGIFSVPYLFLSGEYQGNAAYSYWTHGLFYYIDFLFLLIGLIMLFKKKPRIGIILVSMLLISPLSSAISRVGTTYVLRAGVFFPTLLIIMAYGIYQVIHLFQRYKKIVIISVFVLYLFSFINYCYLYFYRYPIYASEGFLLSERILAEYLQRAMFQDPKQKFVVISESPIGTFYQYLFYTNEYKHSSAAHITKIIQPNNINYHNIFFTNSCIEALSYIDNHTTIIKKSALLCDKPENPTIQKLVSSFQNEPVVNSISNLADAGEIYKIQGDILCQNYPLPKFYQLTSHKGFEVNRMPTANFCQTWITNLHPI